MPHYLCDSTNCIAWLQISPTAFQYLGGCSRSSLELVMKHWQCFVFTKEAFSDKRLFFYFETRNMPHYLCDSTNCIAWLQINPTAFQYLGGCSRSGLELVMKHWQCFVFTKEAFSDKRLFFYFETRNMPHYLCDSTSCIAWLQISPTAFQYLGGCSRSGLELEMKH